MIPEFAPASQNNQPMHRMAIEKTSEYKFRIIDKMIQDDKLTNLIYYNTMDAEFLPPLSEKERENLMWNNIYPYRFNPERIETKTTFIGVDMTDFEGASHQTLVGAVTFFVYTHLDLMRTDMGVRQDEIKGCIGRIFDGDTTLGMGEFKYMAAQPLYTHLNQWGGYAITFELTDLR